MDVDEEFKFTMEEESIVSITIVQEANNLIEKLLLRRSDTKGLRA